MTSVLLSQASEIADAVLEKARQMEIVGAVGVSGDHPENDEACAVFGIEKADLVADAG
jgi:uncharacterized protein GlcG (DUF336 family)